MRNAIILHGRPRKADYYNEAYPSESNSHWLPWLQKQLIIKDIFAATPEVPLAFEPLWERWVIEVERFDITAETVLVGHSMGGGFWLRYLSEHPDLEVGKLLLVAPWIDVEDEDLSHFFDFELDRDLISRTAGITLFHSTDDDPDIVSSVTELRKLLPDMGYIEFNDRGHFTHKYMPSDTFPELLEEILA
jgi:predicted alpha/beta hydrolase family esterase